MRESRLDQEDARVPRDAADASSADPPPFLTQRSPRRRTRSNPVNDVLKQSAAALTARAKSRNILLDVAARSTREASRVTTLREAFLVLLADTLDTADRGCVVRAELRDLAGGRVELRLSDGTRGAELTQRALARRDGSGRSRSLTRVFDVLAREHNARWVSTSGEEGRCLLVDIGFPNEE